MLNSETEKRLDQKTDPTHFKAHVSKLGSMRVGELHGHHNIEDAHYFQVLAKKDTRIARGFEILDRDHHALDEILHRYIEAANTAINADLKSTREIGTFLEETRSLEQLLSRHLINEEELVVPVILKHGATGLGKISCQKTEHNNVLMQAPSSATMSIQKSRRLWKHVD